MKGVGREVTRTWKESQSYEKVTLRETTPFSWGTQPAGDLPGRKSGPHSPLAGAAAPLLGISFSWMGSSLGKEIRSKKKRMERGSGGAKGELQLCVQERKAGPGSAHRGWGGRRVALGKENSHQRRGRHAQVISGINPSPPGTFCILFWAVLYPKWIIRGLGNPQNRALLTKAWLHSEPTQCCLRSQFVRKAAAWS